MPLALSVPLRTLVQMKSISHNSLREVGGPERGGSGQVFKQCSPFCRLLLKKKGINYELLLTQKQCFIDYCINSFGVAIVGG